MSKAKLLHFLHVAGAALIAVAPYLIPAVRDAISHSPRASADLLVAYLYLGKFLPKS